MAFRHRLSAQFVLYAVIGVIQLAADALLFFMLARWGMDGFLANTISRLSAGLLGYLCHALFTFRSDRPPHSTASLLRFLAWWLLCTALGGWVLNFSIQALGTGTSVLGIKVALELVLAALSFVVLRFWVFSPRQAGRP